MSVKHVWTFVNRWKPGVPGVWLHILSGVVWTGVGILLLRWVWIWTQSEGWAQAWPFNAAGLLVGLGTMRMFGEMAAKNRARIEALPEYPCAFAFQSWWSYPLVVFMIGLGLIVKASPLPRTWLSGLYLAIGGGLFVAGTSYFRWILTDSRALST